MESPERVKMVIDYEKVSARRFSKEVGTKSENVIYTDKFTGFFYILYKVTIRIKHIAMTGKKPYIIYCFGNNTCLPRKEI